MKTLALFTDSRQAIPAGTSWYLDALAEFRGKQELYIRQSPQKLKVLREHAMIESAVSSNRIEGVAMEAARIPSVLVATKPLFRDRDEEEIRGYRDALAWLHEKSADIPVSEVLHEHAARTSVNEVLPPTQLQVARSDSSVEVGQAGNAFSGPAARRALFMRISCPR